MAANSAQTSSDASPAHDINLDAGLMQRAHRRARVVHTACAAAAQEDAQVSLHASSWMVMSLMISKLGGGLNIVTLVLADKSRDRWASLSR